MRAGLWSPAPLLGLLLAVGCGGERADGDLAGPSAPTRSWRQASVIGADGRSPPLTFVIPPATRSLAIVVRGDPGARYALGALAIGDQPDLIGLPASVGAPAQILAEAIDHRGGRVAGALRQTARQGLYTLIWPTTPTITPPPGPLTLVALADRPGPITVEVDAAPATDARRLHLALVSIGPAATGPDLDALVAPLTAILAGAGLELVIDRRLVLDQAAPPGLELQHEPSEVPSSAAAQLPGLLGRGPASPALPLFVVDGLPVGVAGLSLGTPGPPRADTYYSGVVVGRQDDPARLARVAAHELGHYLGLAHPEDRLASAARLDDGLDDTSPDQPNLMNGDSDQLSAAQAALLRRSPWLR